jgi:OTU-like cysteine protease/SEC-C motif
MAKKRANTNSKKKPSSVAAIHHARLDDDGDNEDIGNSNPRNNKWKGPKWKRGAKNNNGKQQQHGKKNLSNNNSNDDDQYLRRTIESDGYKTVIEMAADGNCLFRSLSDQLYHDYGNGHEHVREEVCDFLEAHRDDFCAFLLLEEDEEDVTDFDDYVREMRGYGTWGGNVELVVASRLYDRNITIFSCPATAAANNNNNNSNSVHSNSSEKGSGGASIPTELSAFTIHNEHDGSEHDAARKKKNRLPDILLSFHENDHYNSVRDSRNGRPPPPIKTYVKPGTVDNDDEYNDEYNERYYNNQQEQQQHDGYDTEEKTNTSEDSATSASSTASTIDMDEHEQEDTAAADTESATTTNSSSTANPPPPPNPETATLRIKKNDACPCGSGQRYKKCCFAREKHARRVQQMQASKGLAEEESASARSPLQKDAKEDDAEVVMNGNFRVLTI